MILPALMGLLLGCHSTAIAERTTQAVPSPLNPPSHPGDGTGSLSIQGQLRTYLLHTPKSYQTGHPMPLVLAFHGYGSQGKDMAQATGLSDLAEQQKFLVAYPDGLERRWRIATNPDNSDSDERAFVNALIQHLTQIRAVDPNRIYVVGVSNGGFLVQNLACTTPENSSPRIAAFATVASTLLEPLRSACHPPVPISMLMINGTDDQKVPWHGGERPYGSLVSIPAAREFWQQHDRCDARPQVIPQTNQRIEIERYLSCQGGAEVEAVTLKGAGHVWPRGGGGANSLLNGSQEIWNFFQRHPAQ
jgi:polyhydroxybutyrate depolymerase